MNRPTKRILGLTWLGWINFLIFQWLFMRVFLIHNTISDSIKGVGISLAYIPLTGWSFLPWRRRGWCYMMCWHKEGHCIAVWEDDLKRNNIKS